MPSELVRFSKALLSRIGIVLLAVVVLLVGEWMPPMAAFQRFQEANPALNRALTGLTIAMIVLGALLMLVTPFLMHAADLNLAAQTKTAKTGGRLRGLGWLFSGTTISTGFSDDARFWRVRRAFQDGEWWREPRWRQFSLMLLGAVLVFFGLFGLVFLLSPVGVKFLLLLLVLYVTGRGIYTFVLDEPLPEEDEYGE